MYQDVEDTITELEREKMIGWLYVSTLPHYVMARVENSEIVAMRRARETVEKLERAKQLRPLMAAFDLIK